MHEMRMKQKVTSTKNDTQRITFHCFPVEVKIQMFHSDPPLRNNYFAPMDSLFS